jgi:hypothetical protein
MSIVAVHGPNMMYTTEGGGATLPSSPAGATAVKDPANGLKFNFAFPNPGANAATCFDWTFTGPGSPAAQPDKTSGTVTFTGPGAVTIICTVTGATGGVVNQAYTVSATATAGVPRMVEQSEGGNGMVYDEDAYSNFILAEHDLADIQDFLGHYEITEDNWDELISEEEDGANRDDVLDWFNSQRA